MPQMMNHDGSSQISGVNVTRKPYTHRRGCFAARIGAQIPHRLGIPVCAENGQPVALAGAVWHMDIQDITRHPELAAKAKWVCSCYGGYMNHPQHAPCQGRHFDSKEDLIAAHPSNRDLTKLDQSHMYYAVVEIDFTPGKPGVAEEKDDKGRVVTRGAPAVPARPALVMLLSDEE